jgi:hypothetical protein
MVRPAGPPGAITHAVFPPHRSVLRVSNTADAYLPLSGDLKARHTRDVRSGYDSEPPAYPATRGVVPAHATLYRERHTDLKAEHGDSVGRWLAYHAENLYLLTKGSLSAFSSPYR